MRVNLPTAERVRELFDYDPAAGLLLWRVRLSNIIKVGSPAGTVRSDDSRTINIDGHTYPSHRLIWVHQRGEWPKAHVRQKDGDLSNTRIENLYESSLSATNASRGVGSNNTSGQIGVGFNKPRGKWKAWVKRDNKLYHLGYFEDFDEAVAVRQIAEERFVAGAPTAEIKAAGHAAAIERRQRVAWNQINAEFEVAWSSFEVFARDIGGALKTGHRLLRNDDAQPIGPQNFRWFIPPSERFDADTPEGRSQIRREYRQRKPSIVRSHDIKKLYGITPEQYAEKLATQDGVCALCKKAEQFTSGGQPRPLCIDHDHESGVVRDLLCGACNSALGYFNDDPDLMRAAAEYIERHKANIVSLERRRG